LVSGEGYLGKNFIDSFLSNLLWGWPWAQWVLCPPFCS
jgi:hypothetical protein